MYETLRAYTRGAARGLVGLKSFFWSKVGTVECIRKDLLAKCEVPGFHRP